MRAPTLDVLRATPPLASRSARAKGREAARRDRRLAWRSCPSATPTQPTLSALRHARWSDAYHAMSMDGWSPNRVDAGMTSGGAVCDARPIRLRSEQGRCCPGQGEQCGQSFPSIATLSTPYTDRDHLPSWWDPPPLRH